MPTSSREWKFRLLAAGMRRSGALRVAQFLSRRLELSPAPDGRKRIRRARGPKFAILCYHRIGTGGVPFYSGMEPRAFEAQMKFLSRAYRVVSLDQLCLELNGAEPDTVSSKQAVAITFDDGYGDLFFHAFPALRKYGFPATIYLTASAIEMDEAPWYDRIFALAMLSQSNYLDFEDAVPRRFHLSSDESRMAAAAEIIRCLRTKYGNQERVAACALLEKQMGVERAVLKHRMLTWEQIRVMQNAGINFGAHTMTHPVVSRLAPDERGYELADSRRLLEERLQRAVTHFAYPFGSVSDIDADTCSLIPKYGYSSAACTVWGINTPATHRYLLRRIGAEGLSVSQLAFYLRWLFLNDQHSPAELRTLERAAECRGIQVMAPGSAEPCEAGG